MFFTGCIRGAAYSSGMLNRPDDTKATRKYRRNGLIRHWLITLGQFALSFYAVVNL